MPIEHIKARPAPVRPAGFLRLVVWSLFGNADDGLHGDDKWRAGRTRTWWLAVKWWTRNPAHNMCFYVLGFADQEHLFVGEKDWGADPGLAVHWCVTLDGRTRRPLLSYVGKRRGWYIGWRPYAAFGISLNFAKR